MKFDDDMEEELRSHVAHRADDLERSGLTRAEAERRARVEFGARERIKEEIRETTGRTFFETVRQDARFSLRVLRKSPGFTLVAIATLALAIGANAVVFGVLNRVILRPLDVPDAESLYGIEHGNEHDMSLSYPDYRDLRDRNRSFDGLAAYAIEQVGLDTGDRSTRAWIAAASGNYFDVLRIQPRLGRVFHASDERGPNSAPYIVLEHDYWRTRFQEDPNVVGRVVRVNKSPFTIIGVAPPEFHGTLAFFSPEFYVPIVNEAQIAAGTNLEARATRWVFMSLGHLKPGVTTEQAVADLNSIGAYLEKTYPKQHGATTFVLARPGFYGNYLGQPLTAFVGGLMLLSGLILLAACANLGSLFAARAADRSREVALRLALGASRVRILRQLLTEAVIISMAGGAMGLWGGIALLRALAAWHPFPKFPINMSVSPNATVYVMALALAFVSGLMFGIVPARQVFRTDPYQVIKRGAGVMAGRRVTVRDLLLLAQISVCAVLITASIVAIRGLAHSLHSDYGFDPREALLADTDLAMAGYAPEDVPVMQRRMIDAVQTIPGVSAVAIGHPPLTEDTPIIPVFREETSDLRPSNAVARAFRYKVTPAYFEAARTALLLGRSFSWHDDENAPRVAIANSAFAARVFGSASKALGGHFKLGNGTSVEIIGVAQDGKYSNLAEDPRPAIFLPLLQSPTGDTWLIVRSSRDPEELAAAIRTTLRGLDAGLPVYVQTWARQLDFAHFPSRMATASLGVMGAMGAVLAITGVFGMAAYSVSKRMRELGIRMALGAQRRELLQAALGRALKVLVGGSIAGLILGVLASRVLASIVYQATPRDPLVLGGAVLSMLLLGLLATWIPARRALSIDPLVLLREE